MVVLGVLPGLAALAYSVLSFRQDDLIAEPVDCGVLRARGHPESASVWAVGRSVRVHRLIMAVVFERDPPAALALGPAFSSKEPTTHVQCVSSMLSVLALGLNAEVKQYHQEGEVRSYLGALLGRRVGQRELRQSVRASICEPLPTTNRKVVLASAAAIVTAGRLRGDKSRES